MNETQVSLKAITPEQIETLKKSYSGKNLEAVEAAIAMVNESVAAGFWLPRVSRKARAGFSKPSKAASRARTVYRGLSDKFYNAEGEERERLDKLKWIANDIQASAAYGREMPTKEEIEQVIHLYPAGSLDYLKDNVDVLSQIRETMNILDSLLPIPVVTELGFSPKVQATLLECNLRVDLSTVRFPDIERKVVEFTDKNGRKKYRVLYRLIWPEGTMHGASRFASGGHCEACGKAIPSGRFAPFQAFDKESGRHISLFVGSDCAKKIFGVRFAGFSEEELQGSGNEQ
nr:hypothetical protein BdHM001_34710 [Bdellovibrio sp. HM001]